MGSGRVPGKSNIRVSTGKGRIRASIGEGKIRASTGKGRIRASIGNGGSGREPKMWDLGEYLRR